MAIIFGVLLGIALLIGIYVFRSRCWLCPPHPLFWGPSALLEALPVPPHDPPVPKTTTQMFPMPSSHVCDKFSQRPLRFSWVSEKFVLPPQEGPAAETAEAA